MRAFAAAVWAQISAVRIWDGTLIVAEKEFFVSGSYDICAIVALVQLGHR